MTILQKGLKSVGKKVKKHKIEYRLFLDTLQKLEFVRDSLSVKRLTKKEADIAASRLLFKLHKDWMKI